MRLGDCSRQGLDLGITVIVSLNDVFGDSLEGRNRWGFSLGDFI